MGEKSSLSKGSQAFQLSSIPALHIKSDGGRLENRNSRLMLHNSGLLRFHLLFSNFILWEMSVA
jgi:hypothetical protein